MHGKYRELDDNFWRASFAVEVPYSHKTNRKPPPKELVFASDHVCSSPSDQKTFLHEAHSTGLAVNCCLP